MTGVVGSGIGVVVRRGRSGGGVGPSVALMGGGGATDSGAIGRTTGWTTGGGGGGAPPVWPCLWRPFPGRGLPVTWPDAPGPDGPVRPEPEGTVPEPPAGTVETPPEAAGCEVPPLAVQTLVENSIKHAIAPRPGGGRLRVEARAHGERVVLSVWDDGPGFTADALRAGHGLDNLRGRLAARFGADASLAIGRRDGGTLVTPALPRAGMR